MISVFSLKLIEKLQKLKSISKIVRNYNRMSLRADSRCSVRCVESDDDIIISFKYSFSPTNDRYFHFKRNKNEELKQTFSRISLNINNFLTKKMKRKNKKEKSVEIPVVSVVTQLIIDGKNVSQDLHNIEVWKQGAILKIGENQYEVNVNPPTVKSIRLVKSLMAGFDVYPILSLEFCSFKECKYIWFKQRLHKDKVKKLKKAENSSESNTTGNESEKSEGEEDEVIGFGGWIKVCEGFYYKTSTDDIGRKLRVICIPNNGFESEAISENTVEANPGLCPFDERHLYCSDLNDFPLGSFRIISYNILADIYADSEYTRTVLFPYCPPYALHIDYRKQLLIKEITGYNGDIYCLQEVDRQVFENDLDRIMSSRNYSSVFSEKGSVGEGLATFYRPSKFELLSNQTLSISEELEKNPLFSELLSNVSVNEKLLERLLKRKSVFQCLLLRSLDLSERAILLGNTHLYFHPDADNIRLIQSYIYVKFMENTIKQLEITRPDLKVSPILCGDFNSCPEFGVYQLMTTGFVDNEIADFKSSNYEISLNHKYYKIGVQLELNDYSFSDTEETIEGFEMSHSLRLGSACGSPQYTNFTQGFNGCLDYIFHDTNHLFVSDVVPFPSHEQVIQNIAIPSVVFPSDHLALVSTLSWNK